MKEQFLNPSDRAALQGLIPLAGALGAGTIFALFFSGRRRGSGIAVFELFAIVAVLASVGTTAYLAISLLHENAAIDGRDLTQTAMPLVFAVFLLVLVSVLSRLPGSLERAFSVLPLVLVAIATAAWLASSSWSFEPGDTVPMAVLILAVGGLTAVLAWAGDRLESRWDRGTEQRRFVRLSRAGYRVAERQLHLALPARRPGAGRHTVSCWTRRGRVYLDSVACRQLRDRTDAAWDRLADEKGSPPAGATVLTQVRVSPALLALAGRISARLWTFDPGADEEPRMLLLEANGDGLLDVTDLGVV